MNEINKLPEDIIKDVVGYDGLVVCIEHKRFIPCRPCMYQTPATIPYSKDPVDIKAVSDYHSK